jgi:hypothetical protein
VTQSITDYHFRALEGNSSRVLNLLKKMELKFTQLKQVPYPENLELLEDLLKKSKTIENDLRVISNISILYISDYLFNAYGMNLFQNPLVID